MLETAAVRETNEGPTSEGTIAGNEPTGFLRREPIMTGKSALYGYELTYRESAAEPLTGDLNRAAQQVIDSYLTLMPRQEQGKGFVPCTRETLMTGLATLLPRRNTVLEIVPGVEPEAELLAICRELRRSGYRFSLDGSASLESRIPFIDLVDYVKVDYGTVGLERRRIIQAAAQRSRIGNTLIASGVETAEDLEKARGEGFELFQGPVFVLPSTVASQALPSNQVVCLRLMAALSEDPVDTAKIEGLVMMDASLCYRLLRLVNSALYSLNSQVTSIRGALVVVGTDEFRKLVKVALAGALAASQSKSLVALALERARFCEMLSATIHEPAPKLYLMGMLSLIDSILKVSMMQVLQLLPLDPDMKAALLGGQSSIGLALELVRHYQAGAWEECERYQQKLGVDRETVSRVYLDAVHWADEAMRP